MSNISYTFYERDEYLAKKDALGFTCDNFTTDGKYIMVDRGQVEHCEDCNHDIVFPDWFPLVMPDGTSLQDSPHFTEEQAQHICDIKASEKGASDGYWFHKELPL